MFSFTWIETHKKFDLFTHIHTLYIFKYMFYFLIYCSVSLYKALQKHYYLKNKRADYLYTKLELSDSLLFHGSSHYLANNRSNLPFAFNV